VASRRHIQAPGKRRLIGGRDVRPHETRSALFRRARGGLARVLRCLARPPAWRSPDHLRTAQGVGKAPPAGSSGPPNRAARMLAWSKIVQARPARQKGTDPDFETPTKTTLAKRFLNLLVKLRSSY
jgi:hypothetical protein